MTATFAIEVTRLSKRYGTTTVLDGVELSLVAGSRTALTGANGAGKSTLLAILSTLVSPTGGQVRIAGYDLQTQAVEVRRRIGVLGHRPMLYEDLTPLENLLFFARLYGVANPRPRAEAFLEVLGLWSRRFEPVSVLSRGYHQRLAIGRALIHSPEILLLDEPETGLDAEGIELLDALMLREPAFTVLAATHRLDRIAGWADSTANIERGRLVSHQVSAEALAASR
ncbi:MAG: ABC transporter ATP-binding protein [Dehalococcoidia bacterium]